MFLHTWSPMPTALSEDKDLEFCRGAFHARSDGQSARYGKASQYSLFQASCHQIGRRKYGNETALDDMVSSLF